MHAELLQLMGEDETLQARLEDPLFRGVSETIFSEIEDALTNVRINFVTHRICEGLLW